MNRSESLKRPETTSEEGVKLMKIALRFNDLGVSYFYSYSIFLSYKWFMSILFTSLVTQLVATIV